MTASPVLSPTLSPILSIVSPTRGNFSPKWLEWLLQIEGDVQFILVYPPGVPRKEIADPRVKVVVSPFKGEVIQRYVGLLNATGKYVMALDDDDFAHPGITDLCVQYFTRFPDSWVLRLKAESIDYQDVERIYRDWPPLPAIDSLEVVQRKKGDPVAVLAEIPIAPLQNKFDLRHAIWPIIPRRDMQGAHIENFNNKIWRNDLVQQALPDLSQSMELPGPLTWIPFWSLDRLLGLFVQAYFFQPDRTVIGHWLFAEAQIRFIGSPAGPKYWRLMVPSDFLLVKRFSQYGYFWNLFWNQLWEIPKLWIGSFRRKDMGKAD